MPAIALSCKDGICKGSGRSWGDCDLYSLVASAKEHYLKFGGHKMALGLSLEQEKLALVKSILNIKASQMCDSSNFKDESILGILPFSEIDLELLEIIEKFEPYGEANPKPKFITKSVEVVDIAEIGANKEHKRFRLKDGNIVMVALEFRAKSKLNLGDRVDITYTLSKNEYNGVIYINLFLESIIRI